MVCFLLSPRPSLLYHHSPFSLISISFPFSFSFLLLLYLSPIRSPSSFLLSIMFFALPLFPYSPPLSFYLFLPLSFSHPSFSLLSPSLPPTSPFYPPPPFLTRLTFALVFSPRLVQFLPCSRLSVTRGKGTGWEGDRKGRGVGREMGER